MSRTLYSPRGTGSPVIIPITKTFFEIGWLEPMAEWIKEAENLPEIARESNLFAKKVTAKEIFGSNLVLANREARLTAPSGEDLSGGNQWDALRAATEKIGFVAESQILVLPTGIEPVSPA